MKLKSIIMSVKNVFLLFVRPRQFFVIMLNKFAFIFSDSLFLKIKYYLVLGKTLNLKNPQTFTEKLQWLKLNNKQPQYTQMVDKATAKDYVQSILGGEYIIPTYGVWSKFDDIDFSKLPDGFILKCTHDSSRGIVVRNKSQMNVTNMKMRIEKYQKRNYYVHHREYPYKDVPHRIIAEQFLVNGNDAELMDYKFYCFDGRAEYVQIIANRSSNETIDFYDRDWVHQDFFGLNPDAKNAICCHSKPENYKEMFLVADKLSKAIGSPFVRIDLYNVNGHIYFGEITFYPASGMGVFTPNEWDKRLGDLINIKNIL